MAKTRQEWLEEIESLQQRWFTFIDKMEERGKEFFEASYPELENTYKEDNDFAKRTFWRLAQSVMAQIHGMYEKADEIFDKEIVKRLSYGKISDLRHSEDKSLQDISEIAYKVYFDKCRPRLDTFQQLTTSWTDLISAIEKNGAEVKYQAILDEYEQIKDKFVCVQCGSPIVIPHIFLTTTHIQCPACQTQNTFEPSSRARELDFVARDIAEEKTKHLLDKYEKADEYLDEYLQKISDLESKMWDFDEGTPDYNKLKDQLFALKKEYHTARDQRPELYKIYLKAKFDEWIRLVPQLAEQNRRVYEGWLAEFERRQS